MIIWLASYPKSGNTYVRAFLSAYYFSENGQFDFSQIQLDGYHPFIYNNTQTHFGGTGIYVLNKYSFQGRKDLDFNIAGECEASFIELFLPSNSSKTSIVLCSMYRHPHDNHNEFYNIFSETMSKIGDKTPIIVAGDMNINVSSQDTVSQ